MERPPSLEVSDSELSERAVISAFAEIVCARIVRKVIRELQSMKGGHLQSGEDSGLINVWDEYCVQVQFQESFTWDLYRQVVAGLVNEYVARLPRHELDAIWLQTDEGSSWLYEEPEEREEYPVTTWEVESHVLSHLDGAAADYENERIRTYLDRSYG